MGVEVGCGCGRCVGWDGGGVGGFREGELGGSIRISPDGGPEHPHVEDNVHCVRILGGIF